VDHGANVIDPQGAYTAATAGGALSLYRADGGVSNPAAATVAVCPQLLAWSGAQERLACVADVQASTPPSTHGEIHVIDWPDTSRPPSSVTVSGFCEKNSNPISNSSCSASEYDYTQARAFGQRRLFSPNGRFLAFATIHTSSQPSDDFLYWADLSTDAPHINGKDLFPNGGTIDDTSRVELLFSPDETYIAEQRSTLLVVHKLVLAASDPANAVLVIGTGLRASPPCSEAFASAPERWCGNPRNVVEFDWSSDSRFIAFDAPNPFPGATGTDVVMVVRMSAWPSSLTPTTFPVHRCTTECADRPVFQP
jgi:hypothetical protein